MRRLGRRGSARLLRTPGQVIAVAFGTAVLIGTALLMLPVATRGDASTGLLTALFHATSAVCVTGLITVDTGTHWTGFGQAVLLLLIQVGGLGIMTLATLVALLLSRRLGLRARQIAQTETKSLSASDVRRVVRRVVLFSLGSEAVIAVLLTARLVWGYDERIPKALYEGVFTAISAFNNAGFSLRADSLVGFVTDPWFTLTISAAVIIGGLGFPVVFELMRAWRRPRGWSVLTRVTVIVTGILLVVGTVGFLVAEARNPDTLGPLGVWNKVLAAFVAAVMPRTAGFNNLDIGALQPETLFLSDVLMFIGGGSAGTAGGIKVTTFGLLAYVLWAELRGDPDVDVGHRRIPGANQRQALAVALLGLGIVTVATFVMEALTDVGFEQVLFETVSAFGTVGQSTGITPELPPGAQVVLIGLMFIGRLGPLTLASGLALRERGRRHRLPEERTIVG